VNLCVLINAPEKERGEGTEVQCNRLITTSQITFSSLADSVKHK
jgi:hypothetical protein